MNKANSYQQIINKAQEYVRSGKTIINVFFGIGVIEALFVGYILNRMEIGSLTNTLIVAIILGTTYILYILFATIISMLEQLSVNNELLIHLINETQNNGLIERINIHF